MKKERGILFQTEMVKAIIDGRKTMTRRIMKLQPSDDWMKNVFSLCPSGRIFRSNGEQMFWLSNGNGGEIKCHYGKPGDILYVKETYLKLVPKHEINMPYGYKASCDSESEEIRQDYIKAGYPYKWKSPRFMPKVAGRIWLQIEDIRVERVQDISADDCEKEGIRIECGPLSSCPSCNWETFRDLWKKINGEESWNENPWVWVISFKVLSKTGRPVEAMLVNQKDTF